MHHIRLRTGELKPVGKVEFGYFGLFLDAATALLHILKVCASFLLHLREKVLITVLAALTVVF